MIGNTSIRIENESEFEINNKVLHLTLFEYFLQLWLLINSSLTQ